MGITLCYKGTLTNTGKVTRIRNELTNLSQTLQWQHKTWNDDWSKPCDAHIEVNEGKKAIAGHFSLKGATLHYSDKSEAIPILFDNKGNLRNPIAMLGHDLEGEKTAPPIGLKIQNTSTDNFIWLVGLFKYLKKHYIPDLIVKDEVDYWENSDRSKVEAKIGDAGGDNPTSQYTADQIASKLETMFKAMRN